MRFFFALLSISLVTGLFCQDGNPIPIGEVIDSVICQADLKQSYALYLPSNYTHQKTWPIIFALDPMG